MFDFRTPLFMIRDPELAKTLCIKEFDTFNDHLRNLDENIDPLLGKALLSLSGKKWRDMRATLSPAFTGSKMRQMMILIQECNNRAIETIKDNFKESGKNVLEMKEFFANFSVDTIASCAFGLEINSFKNPKNDFKVIAEKSINPSSFLNILKFILCSLVPKIMKKLDISLLDKHTKDFFRQTVLETMQLREEKSIVRPDVINLLIQAKKGKLVHDKKAEENLIDGIATVDESLVGRAEVSTIWQDDYLVAQCLLFFLAGFDTTSSTLAFCAYELAVNQDIQDKLRQEINDMDQILNGENLTYEKLQGMKYLDQFVTEILRKWSPAPGTDRKCNKDFTFNADGKSVTILKDHSIILPIWCWHMDPHYFPNPEKFDPDRFNDENIRNQNMNAYAPFGIGPRSCIGSRLALMEVKLTLYAMLQYFSFEVSEKTQVPLKFKKTMMNVVAENGNWIAINPLKK